MKSASPTDRPATRAHHRAAIRAHRRRAAISAAASAVVCGQRSSNCTLTAPNCRPKTSNRFHHRNQQYSIIALTNGSGAIEERYAYSAYGEPVFTNASGTVLADSAKDNWYTYTGREWDEELSLYHFRARMYDAESGRFTGRDAVYFMDGTSSYASLLWLSKADPTGNVSISLTVSPKGTKRCAAFHIDAPIKIAVSNMDNRPFPLFLVQKVQLTYTAAKCNYKDNCCKKEDEESDSCEFWEILGLVEISNRREGVAIKTSPNHVANKPGILEDNWGLSFNQGDCGSIGSVSQTNEIRLVADSSLEAIWRTANPDTPVESCRGSGRTGIKHLPGPTTAPNDWDRPKASFAGDISFDWDCCSGEMKFTPVNLTITTRDGTDIESP